MLVSRNDIIFLKELSTIKTPVQVDSIPDTFKHEFQMFFFGKTLMKKNNTLFAYPHDIKTWVGFIFDKYNKD